MIKKILKERGNNYGAYKDNARLTIEFLVSLKLLEVNVLSPQEFYYLQMSFGKISRFFNGLEAGKPFHADNFIDIGGYSSLLYDLYDGPDYHLYYKEFKIERRPQIDLKKMVSRDIERFKVYWDVKYLVDEYPYFLVGDMEERKFRLKVIMKLCDDLVKEYGV